MAKRYDAVVVGAGHNGLVCACYLAKAGLSVSVVERTDRIGGACVTEEVWPGFYMSTASYSLSLMLPSIISELGLKLDVRAKEPVVFHPYEDGGGLVISRDNNKAHEAISALSKNDADAYFEFEEIFQEASRRLRPLLSYPATTAQVKKAFKQSDIEDLYRLTVEAPVAELCEKYFETELMQGLMASQGIISTAAGPRTPGTSYILLHHAFGQATGEDGAWGFVRGGMGAITQELARVARELGVEIRTEAEVERLRLDGRKVDGVVLASGEEIEASAVLSNATPARTVALVPDETLPPEFAEDIANLPTKGTVVKVNCALSGLPSFTGMSNGSVGPEHTGTITVSPSIDYLEDAAHGAAEGIPSTDMFLEAWIQTASEDGLAPEGKHTLSIFAQYAPYDLAEGSWDTRRDEIGDLVIATLERFAPGLSDLIEHRIVMGPPDLEARFGLTGGNIFHGEILPEWLFDRRPATGWHRHRLPVAGYYLCGSGAHPGGGVCGAPGANAARALLEDRVSAPGATA